jgi:predicted phage tail protein
VPVGKGQAAAGFNALVAGAAAFLATGFFTALPAFFAAGLLTFFLLRASLQLF